MKVRGTLFAIAVGLVLCSPILLSMVQKAGISVPDWMSSESAYWLEGGISEVEIRPYLNVEGFSSGKLQDALETKLEDRIPFKAAILMGDATVQRCAIELSDKVIPFDCFTSFYSSSLVYCADENALSRMSARANKATREGIERFASGISEVAQSFPEKQFLILVADDSSNSVANPVARLCSNVYTTEDANEAFAEACNSVDNVSVVDATYDNANEYYRHFYRTDHHWNGWGAVAAYNNAMGALADKSFFDENMKIDQDSLSRLSGLDWLKMNGSAYRYGRMALNEPVDEPELPLSEVVVNEGVEPNILAKNYVEAMRASGPIAEYDFYQTWYGRFTDTVAMNSKPASPDSSALVICDSFGTAFKWAASTKFSRVEAVYDLHDNRESADSLRRTLSRSYSDVVILVARASSYQRMLEKFPDYFD